MGENGRLEPDVLLWIVGPCRRDVDLIGAGEQRTDIDLVLAPSRSAKLTLSLVDAAGAPATGMINLFLPGDTPGSILDNRGVPLSPGSPGVPTLEPGEWVAVALGSASDHTHPLSGGDDVGDADARTWRPDRRPGRVRRVHRAASSTVRLGVRGVGWTAVRRLDFRRADDGEGRRLIRVERRHRDNRAASVSGGHSRREIWQSRFTGRSAGGDRHRRYRGRAIVFTDQLATLRHCRGR